jgi:hypothetical protein
VLLKRGGKKEKLKELPSLLQVTINVTNYQTSLPQNQNLKAMVLLILPCFSLRGARLDKRAICFSPG